MTRVLPGPPPGFNVAGARLARAVVGRFWAALATGDEVALAEVLLPDSMANLPTPAVPFLLASMGLTAERCRTMGVIDTIRILSSGALGFTSCESLRPSGLYRRAAWYLAAGRDLDGRWWVIAPVEVHERRRSRAFDLPDPGPLAPPS